VHDQQLLMTLGGADIAQQHDFWEVYVAEEFSE
jgi:hypothetical protein